MRSSTANPLALLKHDDCHYYSVFIIILDFLATKIFDQHLANMDDPVSDKEKGRSTESTQPEILLTMVPHAKGQTCMLDAHLLGPA